MPRFPNLEIEAPSASVVLSPAACRFSFVVRKMGHRYEGTIIVDGPCMFWRFMRLKSEPQFKKALPSTVLDMMNRRIAAMSAAARRANLDLVWVFGDDESTRPPLDPAWMRRRTREVVKGAEPCPLLFEAFFRSMLVEEGFSVVCPVGLDTPAAVAVLAFRFRAHVLSSNRDILRYRDDGYAPPF